jgi:hypothetical protein
MIGAMDGYPITAAVLADRLHVPGKLLRDMLRRHPELVPGHGHREHYRIDRDAERAIRAHPEVHALVARARHAG